MSGVRHRHENDTGSYIHSKETLYKIETSDWSCVWNHFYFMRLLSVFMCVNVAFGICICIFIAKNIIQILPPSQTSVAFRLCKVLKEMISCILMVKLISFTKTLLFWNREKNAKVTLIMRRREECCCVASDYSRSINISYLVACLNLSKKV